MMPGNKIIDTDTNNVGSLVYRRYMERNTCEIIKTFCGKD